MKDYSFIEEKYSDTLTKLKKEIRPFVQLTEDQINLCLEYWESLLDQKSDVSEFLPLLCILEHSKTGSFKFKTPVIKTLKTRSESKLLLHTLSTSQKVIIEESQRKGERIPGDYILSLKYPLAHSDPEVIEWTLRTIEACSSQSILLKDDVLELKRKAFNIFNKHKKACQQIINYLEKRWR